MMLMDGALLQLVQDGTIEPRVAYDRAPAQGDLRAVPRGRGRRRGVTAEAAAAPPPSSDGNRIDRFLAILPKRERLGPAPLRRVTADRAHRRRARADALPRR